MLLINPYRFSAPRFISNDADVESYVLAVEQADGQQLESGVISAYEDFILGCKTDGIWGALKAACILAGARTLNGALVPLVGSAPTNNNFVSGDYNRETGLKGNGSTKYLNSNRNNNADPQNNNHNAVFVNTPSTQSVYILMGSAASSAVGENNITYASSVGGSVIDSRSGSSDFKLVQAGHWSGFGGHARNSGTTVNARTNGTTTSLSQNSNTPLAGNLFVFSRNTGAAPTDARVSFYSIGESLDLAALDSRVERLMIEIKFTINTGLSATGYDIDTLRYINNGYDAGGSLL